MTDRPIAVIGGGSWATAIVKILSDNGHWIQWWMRDAENAAFLKEHRHNPKYLRSVLLPLEKIHLSTDLSEVVKPAEIVIFAVPAAFLTGALRGLKKTELKEKILVSAIKGIEPGTNQIITEYLSMRFGTPANRIAAIAGPCHAEEVAEELTAYLTIGATDPETGNKVAKALRRPNIFTSVLEDLTGIEYAAVLKNIYAIAAGIGNGLNQGDNFQSVLVSHAIGEMENFLSLAVPFPRNINHSVYLGDLLVTCYSPHSRNRRFGTLIGRGHTVRTAQLEMEMIAEGYYASACIWKLSRELVIEMPIADAVYRILYERYPARLEFGLMKEKMGNG